MAMMMTRARRAMAAAAILTLAAAGAGGAAKAAAPAVLGEIPGDAKAVVVIKDVKSLSTKVSNAATRLNVPMMPPDLVGYLTRLAGINKGFDASGSAALVLVKPAGPDMEKEDEMPAGPPPMVVLLPTTDAKGMLENMQPGDADKDGVMELTLPGAMADKGYAATVSEGENKWVVLAQDKDVLQQYLKRAGSLAKGLPAETLKVFEANDVVVWAGIPAVSAGVDKFLEEKQQEITGLMDLSNLSGSKPESMAALEKGAVNELFGGVKQYFKDAQAAMLTVRVTDAGVTLGVIGSFKAGTPFGKFVAAQKPAKALTLQGLPGGDILLAGAGQWDGKAAGDVLSGAVKRVMADEVIAKDPKAADLQKLAEQYTQLLSMSGGVSMVLLDKGAGAAAANEEKEEKGGGIMEGAVLIETADPAKYLAVQMELWKNPIMKQFGSGNSDIEQEFAVSPDAITVKGVKLTKVHMTMKLREETTEKPLNPGSREAMEMVEKMYGKDGTTFYTGEVGHRVLTVIGSKAETLEASVAAAQANTNDLGGNALIAGSKEQVVANPVGVLYLPVTRWMGVMQSMVPGMPPLAPAGGGGGGKVPPLVMSAGVSGSTLTMEMHVPIGAIVAVKDAVQRAMGGGGAMPPGGGMEP